MTNLKRDNSDGSRETLHKARLIIVLRRDHSEGCAKIVQFTMNPTAAPKIVPTRQPTTGIGIIMWPIEQKSEKIKAWASSFFTASKNASVMSSFSNFFPNIASSIATRQNSNTIQSALTRHFSVPTTIPFPRVRGRLFAAMQISSTTRRTKNVGNFFKIQNSRYSICGLNLLFSLHKVQKCSQLLRSALYPAKPTNLLTELLQDC